MQKLFIYLFFTYVCNISAYCKHIWKIKSVSAYDKEDVFKHRIMRICDLHAYGSETDSSIILYFYLSLFPSFFLNQ